MKSVLVTGFEPFGGDGENPSQDIARALDGRTIAGRPVVGAVLPCVFGESRHEIVRLLRVHEPSVVICLGLANGRAEITPERVAINIDDARIPDNAGGQPIDAPVVRSGPAAYWSRLPIKAIVAALQAQKIPASVSQTAGTFVCNHVFYALMHALRWQRGVRGGFIHVPAAISGTKRGAVGLPLEVMTDAITIAIEVAVTTRRDLRHGGGQET
jgi:pyroglutamyl-peptidase